MQNDGYKNISAKLGPERIGLGWLTGITAWRTSRAVSMETHSHPHIELLFCLKGSLVYEIEGYGTATINEGGGLVIPANTRHILKDGTDAPCERIGLHVSGNMSRSRKFGVFTPADFRRIHGKLVEMSAKPFRLDAKLLSAVRELSHLLYGMAPDSVIHGFMRALCCTMLYHTYRTLSQPLVSSCPQMMDEAVRFLEENYAKKIGIEDLARRMGYGRTRLFDLFKQHTGLTPNEYLVRHRIRQAQKLVRQRHLTFGQIARATGFSSVGYFRSVFLKYTGSTLES